MAGEGDAERLVVLLEARIRDFEKNMAKASGTATRDFNKMRNSGRSATRQMEADMLRSTKRINQALASTSTQVGAFGRAFAGAFAAGFSAQAAKELLDTAKRIKNALNATGLSGNELKAVYDKLYASAQKNGAPLEGLATLYSRVSLAQKELGVSSTQIVGLVDTVGKAIRLSGGDAQQASGALLQLSQALGGGKIQAEEYNSLIDGMPGLLMAAAAGIKEAGGSVSQLTALVKSGQVSSKAFFDGIEAGASVLDDRLAGAEATISAGFVRLQNVLVDVAGRFDDSTNASRTLANMIDHTLIPAIQELGGVFSSIANGPIGEFYNWLGATIDRVVQLSADLGALSGLDQIGGNPYIGQGRIQDRIDAAFDGTAAPKGDRKPTEITVDKGTPVKPITLADYPVIGGKKGGGGGRKGGGGGRRSADDRFADDVQGVKDRTAALKEEQIALGLSFQEQQKRSVALDLEQGALKQLRDEARRKGVTDLESIQISQQQRDQIDEVADAYARQADELRKATDAQDMQRDVLKGIFSDLRSALSDGKLSFEEMGNIALNVLDKIIDKIEDQLIDAILQIGSASGSGGGVSGGGGFLGSIFSGIGSLLGFANGTDSAPGGLAMVGERGREIVNLPRGSQVVPNALTEKLMSGRGGGQQNVHVTVGVSVDKDGNLKAFVTDVANSQVDERTPGYVQAGISKYDKGMPGRFSDIMERHG